MIEEPRSYDRFEADDLATLAAVALRDLNRFIKRIRRHSGLADKVLLVALCQGAALHYIDGRNGVKDFDVWTFFADDGLSPRYPARRRGISSFEGSRFVNSTRRVDLIGRTLPASIDSDPEVALMAFLRQPQTASAWHLAKKAVVVVSPSRLRGKVLWPE